MSCPHSERPRWAAACLAVVALLAGSPAARADLTIDSFDDPVTAVTGTVSGAFGTEVAAIGPDPVPGTDFLRSFAFKAVTPVQPHDLAFSYGNGSVSVTTDRTAGETFITYQAAAGRTFDWLTGAPDAGVRLTFSSVTPGGPAGSSLPYTITVGREGGDTLTYSDVVYPFPGASFAPDAAFSWFSGGGDPADVLTQVTSLSIAVNPSGPAGAGFVLDEVVVYGGVQDTPNTNPPPAAAPVPAPPAAVLALAAVPAFGLVRRRRG